MSNRLKWRLFALFAILFFILLYWSYPLLLAKVMQAQKSFNLALSGALNALQAHQQQAGYTLLFISFLYGVFHAVGPGHGKFILTSYLSMEQTQLKQAMRISLLAALVQGVVAILIVSILVAGLTLSRRYVNLSVLWLERASFGLMIVLGLIWFVQGVRGGVAWWQTKQPPPILQKIQQIRPLATAKNHKVALSVHSTTPHAHSSDCGCGHQHLPTASQLKQQQNNWQSQLLLILSMGSRPCSGAILVLFLAYTLDLYIWGVASALAMAVGTGLTLSLFAVVVQQARQRAVVMSSWYISHSLGEQLKFGLKLFLGLALIIFGIVLLHSNLLTPISTGFFKK